MKNNIHQLQQDLQIPKEQIELLKQTKGNTIEDKLVDFAVNYNYTVEVNIAKENGYSNYSKNDNGYQYNDNTGDVIELTKEQYDCNLFTFIWSSLLFMCIWLVYADYAIYW